MYINKPMQWPFRTYDRDSEKEELRSKNSLMEWGPRTFLRAFAFFPNYNGFSLY